MSLHIVRGGAQLSVWEDEMFGEVTCPFTQALALPLTLIHHSAPAIDHPEVVLLPVGLELLVALSNHPAPANEHPEVVLLPVGLKI